MEAWIEYSQGRLPWPGSVANQDHIVLRGLQIFASHRDRLAIERQDRSDKVSRSKRITMEAKKAARSGGVGLPTGINVSRGEG